MLSYLKTARSWVAELGGRAESLACTAPGEFELTRFEMAYDPQGFGFGYNEGGELTHHIWLSKQGGEHKPLIAKWAAFRTYPQFLELLSLLKSVGDQFHLGKMRGPPAATRYASVSTVRSKRTERIGCRRCRRGSGPLPACGWELRKPRRCPSQGRCPDPTS